MLEHLLIVGWPKVRYWVRSFGGVLNFCAGKGEILDFVGLAAQGMVSRRAQRAIF